MQELIKKCPKKMLNGPCGGSFNGRCEVGGICVWYEIYKKSKDFIAQPRGIESFKPQKKDGWLSGKFLTTTEASPPAKGQTTEKMENFLQSIDAKKIDAVNVVDRPLGIPLQRGVPFCQIVQKYSLRPILQIVCRDRTRQDIIKELKNAQAAGVEDVLCLTGDWPKKGRASFALDGTQLAALAKSKFPAFNIGVAVNPNVRPLEMELLKFKKKMRFADFAQSQAVFDLGVLEKFATQHGVDKPILIGVLPLTSEKMASEIQKVPGIKIPEDLIHELRENSEVGIKFARELVKKVKALGFAGVHAMTFMNAALLNSMARP